MTLDEALEPFNNNKARLARALGISKQAITKWDPDEIPNERALELKYEILPKIKREQEEAETAA